MSHSSASFHWIVQRSSACILIPMSIWFIFSIIPRAVQHADDVPFLSSLTIVEHVTLLLFMSTSLYHGFLGIQTIMQDYISCIFARWALNVMLITASIFALLIFAFQLVQFS